LFQFNGTSLAARQLGDLNEIAARVVKLRASPVFALVVLIDATDAAGAAPVACDPTARR
jgi:hypothetical protein